VRRTSHLGACVSAYVFVGLTVGAPYVSTVRAHTLHTADIIVFKEKYNVPWTWSLEHPLLPIVLKVKSRSVSYYSSKRKENNYISSSDGIL
jgi:hypothetical protein